MDQLLREFLGEAVELIEGLADDVQALRTRNQDGRTRRELVARIFRHAHTLKGSSSSLELTAISELTHEFETLLDSVRSGRLTLDESVLDLFDEAISAISQMLGALANTKPVLVPSTLVARLRSLAETGDNEQPRSWAGARLLSELPNEVAGTLSELEKHRLLEALSEGAGAFTIDINFELLTFDKQFKDLSGALNKCGEIISTQPGVGTSASHQIAFRIVYATENTASQLTSMFTQAGPFELKELVARLPRDEKATNGLTTSSSGQERAGLMGITPLSARVRIDVSELDDVIIATHSLFKETMDTLALAAPLEISVEDDPSGLKIRAEQVRKGFEELERSLFGLRTVPVVQMLERAIRAGTAAARATGKEIDFEIQGGETRLDKTLSDVIADPLLHLLRNAVDHGIESPSERASLGKAVRGLIKLEAMVEDGDVRLRIIDNGRGIDPKHVTRAAIDRGIIQGKTEVSREESLRIIFAPGFSTAEAVSNVSGRGVGLDVVSRAVEQVGGTIRVHSEIGVGTTFELLLRIATSNVQA